MIEDLDRVLQTRAGRRVISQYYLDVAGSDYRRYGRNTRWQRCFDWIRSRFNYRSGLELRSTLVAGGRLD